MGFWFKTKEERIDELIKYFEKLFNYLVATRNRFETLKSMLEKKGNSKEIEKGREDAIKTIKFDERFMIKALNIVKTLKKEGVKDIGTLFAYFVKSMKILKREKDFNKSIKIINLNLRAIQKMIGILTEANQESTINKLKKVELK